MLLALDLGNTSLSAGVFDGKDLLLRLRVPVADFSILVQKLEQKLGRMRGDLDRVALASVNPLWDYALRAALHTLLPDARLIILGRDVRVPVEACVKNPGEVGVDRLLNVLAAFRRTGAACLVVDFGSALTLDVVSGEGAYLGGVIAPGIAMSASALHAHTALLPEVKPERVERVTGNDTIHCIRSGLFWGTIGMLEGLVARLRQEHPAVKRVLATGGDAEIFAGDCAVIDEVVPALTLEGIRLTLEETAT